MTARWVADPCAMPVGHDQTCALPGDHPHWDGCEPHRVHVPRCLCSHTHADHTRGTGQCWSAVCGCREYREGESIPARLDERYDPSPEPIDRSIQ